MKLGKTVSELNVYDMLGQTVYHSLLPDNGELKLDLSAYMNGIYTLQVIDLSGYTSIQKVLLIK